MNPNLPPWEPLSTEEAVQRRIALWDAAEAAMQAIAVKALDALTDIRENKEHIIRHYRVLPCSARPCLFNAEEGSHLCAVHELGAQREKETNSYQRSERISSGESRG